MRAPSTQPRRADSAVATGFTVVEILVVLGIIIGVITTLLVGLNAAARRSRVANTASLMNTIALALAQFKADTGYLPPMLGTPGQVNAGTGTPFGTVGWARDLLAPPALAGNAQIGPDYGNWSGADRQNLQRWCSSTSLPEYLVGFGDRSQDGWGVILDSAGALPTDTTSAGWREQPALGIRPPGQDGVWGALLNPRTGTSGNGRFDARNLAVAGSAGNTDTRSPFLKGRSLGPYLEVKSTDEVGALTGFASDGTPQVAKVGEINNFDLAPKVLLDYFGKPIMYYRRGYLNSDPKTIDPAWSLADIIALRPQTFGQGDVTDALADSRGDTSASRAARAAEFALLSFGPDQRWNPQTRVDDAGYNEDNIVRFGP